MKKLLSLVLACMMMLSMFSAALADDEVVFTLSYSEDLEQIGFSSSKNIAGQICWRLMYDELVGLDDDGNFLPNLVKEWACAEDGLTWTVKLQPGVTFQNGNPFTSAALKLAMDLILSDPADAAYATWAQYLESVETPDELTAVFHMIKPMVIFLSSIRMIGYVDPVYYAEKGQEAIQNPIGCGPFQFVAWNPGNSVEFKRYDGYWNWPDGVPSNVDKVVYKPIVEDTTRISAVRTGEIDLIVNVPYEQQESLANENGVVLASRNGTNIGWFGMECEPGHPFNDKNIRLAFTHCIDRELIAEFVLGTAAPLYWMAPKSVLGYDEEMSTKYNQYDPELAAQLLKDSSYNGEEVVFICSTSKLPRTSEIVQALISMMKEVGFNVSLQILDGAGFLDLRNSGAYDLSMSNIMYDADSTGFHVYHIVNNLGHYSLDDAQLIQNFSDTASALTAEQQKELLVNAISYMSELGGPLVPFVALDTVYAYREGWEGFKVMPNMSVDARYIKLTK